MSAVKPNGGAMKLFKPALIMFGLLLCWVAYGYADRLYTWTDAKGQTHITQDPPPDTAKVVDTIDYSPQPAQPVRRPAVSGRPVPQAENVGRGTRQAARGSDTTGFTYENPDDDDDYQYIGGPYRQTLRRYEREGDWLDTNTPGRGGDFPVRVQPRSGGRR
jgi:hypothetical protein